MDTTPLFTGFIIMSLASLAIYATGAKAPPARTHTYFHSAVTFIAATSYLAMTCGIGDVLKPDGTITLTARYADWAVTTPILLAGLVLTAVRERTQAAAFLVAIVVLDVLMILAGLISSLAVLPAMKLLWFLWSTAAFVGVLYVLWVPLRVLSHGHGGAMHGAYVRNLSLLTIVWLLYPVVFAIGPEGTAAISAGASIWAILVLDVVAKVAYAFVAAATIDHALRAEASARASER